MEKRKINKRLMMGFKTNCPKCQKSSSCRIDISDGKCLNYSPDDISYAQHRLYRGILLPALTESMGETNNQYCHEFILKPEWIYRKTGKYYYEITCYEDIPVKHRSSARINSERVTIDKFGEPCTEIQFYGYIPSMASFTKAEAKDYFLFCETMLMEIGGQIPTADNQEYEQLRARVLK